MPRKEQPKGSGLPKRRLDKSQSLPEAFAPVLESIMRSDLTDSAKLTWARLAQFSSKANEAFPSVLTLAKAMNHSRAKVERSLRDLRKLGYLETTARPGRANLYHLMIDADPPSLMDPPPSSLTTGDPSSLRPIKEPPSKEQLEKHDYDCPPANRVRDSQAALAQRLQEYFGKKPSRQTVERVRLAAQHGAGEVVSDALIIATLESLERVYPRGHSKGPETWQWFVVTVGNRFAEARQDRERCALPSVATDPLSGIGAVPAFLETEESESP